ncbi:uncharacterized protein LOC125604417 [Brassica napus]|uniref:uncharacterized protein LOC125604417 n=1 Tax=Brassica napus TaxID=3708 RepID=UPI002078994E|nr:uncharacterized protein LOC125604417 [Brassica napus]
MLSDGLVSLHDRSVQQPFVSWPTVLQLMLLTNTSDSVQRQLGYDQKWCEVASSRRDVSGKKRKCDDGAQSESSQATYNLGDEPTNRPPGVKAAKRASGKRSIADSLSASEYQTMWSIKERDLAAKERLSKMALLDRLIGKKDPLTEYEEALKNKLISEMLG